MRRPTETAASDTLTKVFARFFVHGWAGADLLGRLRLCLFIFIAAIFTLIAVAVILTGIFFPHETTALSLQLDRFEHNLKTHFDHVTAHGIYFSQRAAMEIEKTLLEQGAAFEDVSDSQKLIAALEKDTYPLVYEVLRLAEGSGSFLILDATVNTKLPDAAKSRAGVFLKLANLNTPKPVPPVVLQARGIPDIGHENGHIIHNKWQLEFDVSRISFYGALLKAATKNPVDSYYYSPAFFLHGTWEKIIVLCVPIVGENGQVYGIAGVEISSMIFKLRHAMVGGRFERATALLAQKKNGALRLETGLTSGTSSGYHDSGLDNGLLTVRQAGSLNEYTVPGRNGDKPRRFVGVEREIALSSFPGKLDGASWIIACLIPGEDYDHKVRIGYFNMASFFLAFLGIAFLLAHILSRRYLLPIRQAIRAIMEENAQKTDINEIDDLLEFVAGWNKLQSGVDISGFHKFKENLNKLSRAETAVFKLYIEGDSIAQIAEKLFVSSNTIKSHTKNIFRKLDVSSVKELRVYGHMMKDEG